jgi:hypothetical protein
LHMPDLSRREFLKIAGLSLGSLAFDFLPWEEQPPEIALARCTASQVAVLQSPNLQARQLRLLTADDIVSVIEKVQSDTGPSGNPRWFRLLDGFAHTAFLQEVQWRFQPVEYFIPLNGRLMEITIPFTTAFHEPRETASPRFRLYYQSVHWVREVRPDLQGRFWYGIRDDRSATRYFIRAEHARAFPVEEIAPLSPKVAPGEKRVEVDLLRQTLKAIESEKVIFTASISSGAPQITPRSDGKKTSTPTGEFRVFRKMPSQHLVNTGRGDSSQEPFDLPGVPWVSYYQADNDGYAFHGAYWHNDFGRPHSHGCINLRPEDARWLYRWLDPQGPLEMFPSEAPGTKVSIFS